MYLFESSEVLTYIINTFIPRVCMQALAEFEACEQAHRKQREDEDREDKERRERLEHEWKPAKWRRESIVPTMPSAPTEDTS